MRPTRPARTPSHPTSRAYGLACAVLACALLGCGGSKGGTLCTAGATVTCSGPGGCLGQAVCNSGGTIGDCTCASLDLAAPPDLVIAPDLSPPPDLIDGCALETNCSVCPDANSCAMCCGDTLPDPEYTLIGYLIMYCACMDMAPCATACGAGTPEDICTNQAASPSNACVTCLSTQQAGNAACYAQTVTTCNSDPTCKPIVDCALTCPH